MQIRVKGDCVEIEGYVNAVERKSKPLWSRMGQFIERICKGAFKRALGRADDVKLLLNHDESRVLASTRDKTLELNEDNIGLHARATINDAEVAQKARNGELVGWSFGFFDRDVEQKRDEDGFPLRNVRDLDLEEVSILDKTKTPAYDGTLVAVRSEENSIFYGDTFFDGIQLRELSEERDEVEKTRKTESQQEEKEIDYSKYDHMIDEMKQRYNHNHGSDGKFSAGGGSGGGGASSGGSGGGSSSNWGYKGFHEQADKLTEAIKKANTPKRIQEISLSAKKLIKSIDKELENPEGNVPRLKGAKYKAQQVIKEAEKKF